MAMTASEVLFERLRKQLEYTVVEFDLDAFAVVGVLEMLKAHIIWPEDFEEAPDESEDDEAEDPRAGD